MMYLIPTLLLPLLANGAVIQLEPRQLMNGLAGMLPKQKAFKIENIAPQTTVPGAKRVRYIYGPYKVRAANNTAKVGNGISMDKGGTSWQYQVDDDFPKDITVLKAASEVQTKDFKRATTEMGIYNHHNVFMDISKPPGILYGCSNGPSKEKVPFSVFAAGATESGSIDFFTQKGDLKTGYYLPNNRKLTNMIDVINYNNEERELYTSTELEYLTGKPEGYLDVNQHRVDPGICGGPDGANIHPPKGVAKFSVNSTNIVASQSGYIINARGHMHDGGVNMFLKINDKIVCDSRAEYGGEGHVGKAADGSTWQTIRQSSYCIDPVKIQKGDKVYIQANYDTELHPSRKMGGEHGGMSMGGMKWLANVRAALSGQDEDAEQMALFITYFAATND